MLKMLKALSDGEWHTFSTKSALTAAALQKRGLANVHSVGTAVQVIATDAGLK